MAKGDPQPSPWVWQAEDFQDRVIRITVTFNVTTRAITGIVGHRDAGCLYTKILIGTSGGSADATDKAITVPVGDTTLTPGQLAALASKGLSTIDDVLALQITAAP